MKIVWGGLALALVKTLIRLRYCSRGLFRHELLYIEDPSLFDEFKLYRYIHYVTVINDHWYIVS